MKAIIADDEPNLLQHLKQMLGELWPDLDIVACADNGKTALELIIKHQPDIAFLDIQMPSLTGLEVATQIAEHCDIVFVTAYDNYAIQAFESKALDYLLKPISKQRLLKTIERLQQKHAQGSDRAISSQELLALLASLNQRNNNQEMQWIRATVAEDTFLIHIDDVLYFEADSKYTSVVSKDGSYPIRSSLNELEEKLDENKFRRIHRNAIVNLHAIAKFKRLIDGRYILYIKDHPKELTVSRSYAGQFKTM